MNIAIVEDYGDVFRRSPAYARLQGHEVSVHTEPEIDLDRLAQKLQDAKIVVLTHGAAKGQPPVRVSTATKWRAAESSSSPKLIC
jgi:hypothetical protein